MTSNTIDDDPLRAEAAQERVFVGGGEMGELMRRLDWSATPLGPASGWPQSLKTAISILLASGYPMYIAWGPEFVQFYNDAYRPILGATKHPRALGQTSPKCFPEIWEFIGPMFQRAMDTGEATYLEDQILPLDRYGYVEECYFTFSYSAIREERGGVGGVFVTCIETSERVIGERRVATLRELATATAAARSVERACEQIEQALCGNPHDLPFALLYLLNEAGATARIVASAGIAAGEPAAPKEIALGGQEVWPLSAVLRTGSPARVSGLSARIGPAPAGVWPERTEEALVLPIIQPGREQLAGFLVAGISPRRALDDAYRGFLDLLAGSVATALGNARAYEAERERAEALAELDRAKTTFFSNVSHEFRTPLTLMLGPLHDIVASPSDALSDACRESLVLVQRNGLRLLKLVNTLLDFSRIEAGRVEACYEPTDLSAYTAELASVFRAAVERAGMRLIVDCPPLGEQIYVDREMWEKIVLNLLSNAFKFTLQGEITVRLRLANGFAELSVKDTGAGIPAKALPHIFERFHRVEGAPARTHEGTGIGLALVSELARLHGGSVTVESVYGEGTTFTVSIPRGSAHLPEDRLSSSRTLASTAIGATVYTDEMLRWLPAEDAASAAVSADMLTPASAFHQQPNAGAQQVLVVDDNADMREYLLRLLSRGFAVETARNGREALAAVRRKKPDIVVSDIMMPEVDGLEMLAVLRSDPETRALPVILLSARAGEEARIEGLQAGADDYLVKPFSANELLARVSARLELARVRRQAAEERERLIRVLEVERARLAEVLMQAPAFLAILRGPEHVFDLANLPYRKLVGERELIGKTVREALPDIAGQGYYELLDQVYQTAEPFVGTNMRVLLQNSPDAPVQERYVDFTYQPLREMDGSVSGIIALGVDLTARRQAEQEKAAAYERIDALNRQLRRAMSETHHRVKNNLQVITSLIESQLWAHERAVPTDEVRQIIQHIRSLATIHDLLTQQARTDELVERVSIREALERLLPTLKGILQENQIRSSIQDASVSIRQGTALALLVNELVFNAVKHGSGMVDLRFHVDDREATLEVLDEGPGFPPDFDVKRSANTGLEIIESLARWDMQGTTRYENRPEGGARVVIQFPLPQSA